ncbi:hypothetical protein G3578_13675 [Brevibacillus sp. SYP-B805]|uniref:hypothetical protein n=1 Tax=Brevibacillus sp. SYP-B805 TaxID=1578199 RepID=UPI0013E9BE41|nr:hypothetical protein [Brevibacillus sp. SYP-B805]NGQ96211.1 hypothetical protein [Brevibacillus sp. SYP-B805]
MADHPRDTDIQQSRLRQLNEPYPFAAEVVDQIVAEKAASSTVISNVPETPSPTAAGLQTTVPSNYEIHLGQGGVVTKSMTDFEVKKAPGRL